MCLATSSGFRRLLANPALCKVMAEVSDLSERERQAKVRRLLHVDAVPSRTAYRPGTNYGENANRWRRRPTEGLESPEDQNLFQEMAGLVRDVLDQERDGRR
jgi:hypothetical protein